MKIQEPAPEAHIMREITPLSERDCFYVVDRQKAAFDYPLHIHEELELNFIEHAAGARRIVGDSTETIGEYELVLIAGPELEHGWEQGDCRSQNIREITIQFSAASLPDILLQKNQFDTIRRMLQRARRGLAFPMETIMKIYARLEQLAHRDGGFRSVLDFLEVLYELSLSEGARELSSSAFSHAENRSESRRVARVQQYIAQHFHEDIRLDTLADLVGMTPVGFSRFFRQRTGRTLSDYIIDQRIGHASRLLVDSKQTVAEICYDCGFNTLSNFNRLFRRRKGCSPTEFRENYQKKKVFI